MNRVTRVNAYRILTPEEIAVDRRQRRATTFPKAQMLYESSSIGSVHYYGARDKHFVY